MTDTPDALTLRPCPFCGGKCEIERIGNRRQSTIYQCENCGCSLETGEEWEHGRDWNKRADDARLTAGDAAIKRVAELEIVNGHGVITWARRALKAEADLAAARAEIERLQSEAQGWIDARRKNLSKQGITHGHYHADLAELETALAPKPELKFGD